MWTGTQTHSPRRRKPIVLLHSTSATNAAILDDLLTKWEEMGYTFAPLTQLPGLS